MNYNKKKCPKCKECQSVERDTPNGIFRCPICDCVYNNNGEIIEEGVIKSTRKD